MPRTLLAVLLLASGAVFAQEASLLEWGKGPMQWLMTREEVRAWRDVKTVEQAREFIDLFWARRDPTPGTPVNELRQDIESRVAYADENFKERGRRGSLSERGRVLITLGFPKNLELERMKRTAQYAGSAAAGGSSLDPTGGRAQAARDVWTYTHEQAVRFNVPKIEVVFLHDGIGDRVRRDPQRTDFISALPHAIQYYIRNPELTTVPEWGRSGLRWKDAPTSEPAPEGTGLREAPSEVPPSSGPSGHLLPPGEGKPIKPAGAGRLTLVRDAFAIDAQSGRDPFSSLSNVTTFKRDDELGWAAEYCTGSPGDDLETVEVALRVSGTANGKRVTMSAPADELAPDAIKSSPGCYVVRGGIPLADMDAGNYTLSVTIASYNLTRDFQVE